MKYAKMSEDGAMSRISKERRRTMKIETYAVPSLESLEEKLESSLNLTLELNPHGRKALRRSY